MHIDTLVQLGQGVTTPQENVVTYPGVKGNFLRFELQSPINRTGNTWHIQAAAIKRHHRCSSQSGIDLQWETDGYGRFILWETDGQPLSLF